MHRSSLLALAAATAAVTACQQESATDTNVADEPALNLPSVPLPQPPMDRAALLAAVAEAASAAAAGAPMPEAVQSLDGRQFEVRIRFGCRGPAPDLGERWLGWSFDPQERRIRVRAMPTLSSDDPLVKQMATTTFEAVEGFWIPRPWLLQPVCPAAAAVQSGAGEDQARIHRSPTRRAANRIKAVLTRRTEDGLDEPIPGAPRIGIAQFFTSEDPRSRRRGTRPYQAAHTLKEGQALSSQGYNLVLSGRLRALPGKGVIHCAVRSPDTPPECIVSAEFLRVWIEQPDTREVIAEWGTG